MITNGLIKYMTDCKQFPGQIILKSMCQKNAPPPRTRSIGQKLLTMDNVFTFFYFKEGTLNSIQLLWMTLKVILLNVM